MMLANTSRLIAIMLGRLAMDVDECITAYSELMEQVFGERKRALPVGLKGNIKAQFDSGALKRAIEKVVASRGLLETALLDDGVEQSCKV
jgi:hypothetical protein